MVLLRPEHHGSKHDEGNMKNDKERDRKWLNKKRLKVKYLC
jgi:hypothetical protein